PEGADLLPPRRHPAVCAAPAPGLDGRVRRSCALDSSAMATPELLHRLLVAAGPSGRETAPAKVWRDGCATFSDDVRVDAVGSSLAPGPGTGDGPMLAVIGHVDEIGIHVTHIEDEGHLRFGQVGGWDAIVLVGQRVT